MAAAPARPRKKTPIRAVAGVVAGAIILFAGYRTWTNYRAARLWNAAVEAFAAQDYDAAIAQYREARARGSSHAQIVKDFDGNVAAALYLRAQKRLGESGGGPDVSRALAEDLEAAGRHGEKAAGSGGGLPFEPAQAYLEAAQYRLQAGPAGSAPSDADRAAAREDVAQVLRLEPADGPRAQQAQRIRRALDRPAEAAVPDAGTPPSPPTPPVP